jgi:hypothetical protein
VGGNVHLGSIFVNSVIPRHGVAGVGTAGFKARIEVVIHPRSVRSTPKMRSVPIR